MFATTLMASSPEVTNVSFQQTADGTGTVLISYDVADADGDILDINLNASSNGGLTWNVQCDSLMGAVGEGITAGTNKMIFWFAGNDYPETFLDNLVFRILADDNFGPGAPAGYVTLQTDNFVMGSPSTEPGSDWNERPQHNVNINRYIFMAETEVTQESWLSLMGSNPSSNAGCDSCPVEQVSWHNAVAYCNALSNNEGLDPAYIINGTEVSWSQFANGYFLPTEAIWEYACRASTTTAFANGEITDLNCADPALDLISWYCGNADNTTHQVATKSENSWSLFDMHGNVSEWCWDYYAYGYYSESPEDDPTGPDSGTARVIRGGSYEDVARMSRSATRNSALPETVSSTTGLRVCRWAEGGPEGTAYIQIDTEPNELNASWMVTAPNGEEISGNGDQTLTVSLMGEYTISWSDVEEWNTPTTDSQTLLDGETITFTGTYNPISVVNMIEILAGSFVMGSPTDEPGRNSNETEHTVTLTNGFYMSETEVTEELWDQVMGSGSSTSQYPKASVSWDNIMVFCNTMSEQEGLTPVYTIHGTNGNTAWNQDADGYRLPTEAEWEYAVRAGTSTSTHISESPSDSELAKYAWFIFNSESNVHPVGEKLPNPWGLYDMYGNEAEWVFDAYSDSYSGENQTDPTGPTSGEERAVRGGGWYNLWDSLRSANRQKKHFLENGNGFRLVFVP